MYSDKMEAHGANGDAHPLQHSWSFWEHRVSNWGALILGNLYTKWGVTTNIFNRQVGRLFFRKKPVSCFIGPFLHPDRNFRHILSSRHFLRHGTIRQLG